MVTLIKYWWDGEESSMGKLLIGLASIAAVASVALNVALVQRLQSIAVDDLSYILDPKNGMVWQLYTHAEFLRGLTSDSLIPYWAQAPIRVETIDSLVLVGYLTPITDKCDWRRIERYRELQRTCFHKFDTADNKETTIIFEKVAEISPEFSDHPVVTTVAARLDKAGKVNHFATQVMPIFVTSVAPLSRASQPHPEPKAAILFRGWGARNFEIVTAMVPPSPNDYGER